MPFTAPPASYAPRRASSRSGPARTIRAVLALVAAATLTAGLAACSTGSEAAPGASPSGKEWSYKDGSGTTFTLPSTPKRVVTTGGMFAALYDLGVRPIGVLGTKPKADDPSWKGVDIDKLQWFGGQGDDGLNLEKLAAAKPDVVVAEYDKPNKAYWGYGDDTKGQDRTKQFTDLIGFDITGSIPTIFDRVSALATDLGADPNSASTTKLKKDFQKASERVKTAAAAKPGLTIGRFGADKSGVSFGCTSGQNDIAYWQELGLTAQQGPGCNNTDGSSSYWGSTVSWENISKYPVDVLIDNTNDVSNEKALVSSNPVFASMPAVKAGQVDFIGTFPALSYTQYIANLNAVAAAIEKSKVVTR